MLLQTNSYIVPKERRAEHARLIRRFRQALAKIGCDQFEVFEQVGANWSPAGANGRYVQIMRFRDRQHQQAVQAAERSDPGAQQIIAEFCELINFPYQQQQGYFATGFYTSVLPVGPRQAPELATESQQYEEGEEEEYAEGATAEEVVYDEEGEAPAGEPEMSAELEEALPSEETEPLADEFDAAPERELSAASVEEETALNEEPEAAAQGEQTAIAEELEPPLPEGEVASEQKVASEEDVASEEEVAFEQEVAPEEEAPAVAKDASEAVADIDAPAEQELTEAVQPGEEADRIAAEGQAELTEPQEPTLDSPAGESLAEEQALAEEEPLAEGEPNEPAFADAALEEVPVLAEVDRSETGEVEPEPEPVEVEGLIFEPEPTAEHSPELNAGHIESAATVSAEPRDPVALDAPLPDDAALELRPADEGLLHGTTVSFGADREANAHHEATGAEHADESPDKDADLAEFEEFLRGMNESPAEPGMNEASAEPGQRHR